MEKTTKPKNNTAILVIALILIAFGLIMSGIGGVQALSNDLPGSTEITDEAPAIDGSSEKPADTNAENPADNKAEKPTDANAEKPAETDADANGIQQEGEAPMDNGAAPQEVSSVFSFFIMNIAPILVYILLAVYILVEFRKPHGNLFRFTLLFYALILAIWSISQGENVGCGYILPCAAVIVAYLSGRLNKIKKNILWISIVAIFLIGYGVLQLKFVAAETSFGIIQIEYCFSVLIQWIALMLAYFSRFDEHKEAGIAEASCKGNEAISETEINKEDTEKAVEEEQAEKESDNSAE